MDQVGRITYQAPYGSWSYRSLYPHDQMDFLHGASCEHYIVSALADGRTGCYNVMANGESRPFTCVRLWQDPGL
jgi:hypothetical protein